MTSMLNTLPMSYWAISHSSQRSMTGVTMNEWMNECLTSPQHEKQIGYWVSEKGSKGRGMCCHVDVYIFSIRLWEVTSFSTLLTSVLDQVDLASTCYGGRRGTRKALVSLLKATVTSSWKIFLPALLKCLSHIMVDSSVNFSTSFTYRARWSSVVRAFALGAMGLRIDPSYWTHWAISRSSQCSINKGHGMCYSVCGMIHIIEPVLLIGKSSPRGSSGFPLSLSEWSFTICLTSYNHK